MTPLARLMQNLPSRTREVGPVGPGNVLPDRFALPCTGGGPRPSRRSSWMRVCPPACGRWLAWRAATDLEVGRPARGRRCLILSPGRTVAVLPSRAREEAPGPAGQREVAGLALPQGRKLASPAPFIVVPILPSRERERRMLLGAIFRSGTACPPSAVGSCG